MTGARIRGWRRRRQDPTRRTRRCPAGGRRATPSCWSRWGAGRGGCRRLGPRVSKRRQRRRRRCTAPASTATPESSRSAPWRRPLRRGRALSRGRGGRGGGAQPQPRAQHEAPPAGRLAPPRLDQFWTSPVTAL